MSEITEEGRPFQSVYALALVRPKMPMFPQAWTLMHVIDEASPLHGVDAAQLSARIARFYVAIEGQDTALQAMVQDMRVYTHAEIAHGMRYVDMITLDDAGRSTADLSKLSALEPAPAAAHG